MLFDCQKYTYKRTFRLMPKITSKMRWSRTKAKCLRPVHCWRRVLMVGAKRVTTPACEWVWMGTRNLWEMQRVSNEKLIIKPWLREELARLVQREELVACWVEQKGRWDNSGHKQINFDFRTAESGKFWEIEENRWNWKISLDSQKLGPAAGLREECWYGKKFWDTKSV